MSDKQDTQGSDLTDSELLQVIKRHTTDRRGMMKVIGAGAALAALGGPVAAREPPDRSRQGRSGRDRDHSRDGHPRRGQGRGPNIDAFYGETYRPGATVPSGKVDHTVELHIHEHAIQNPDPAAVPFHFAPTGLHIDAGDVVAFEATTPDHTITAYSEGFGRQQRVPDDKPPFSSPLLSFGATWLYHFDSPGTYDLLCAPHEYFGMVMRIVVGDPDDQDYDGTFGPGGPPPQPRPPVSRPELASIGLSPWPFPTANEVLSADALGVSEIVSQGQVSIGDIEDQL